MKRICILFFLAVVALVGTLTGVPSHASAACQEWVTTNDQHVSAGRAYTETSSVGCNETTTYYALGSDISLGTSGSASTALYTEDGQTYLVGNCPTTGTDADGDGYTNDEDCNDNNAAIYPGAAEVCDDGIDQDCDGSDCQTSACQEWSATNSAHASAGRAYTETTTEGCSDVTTYYAVGSSEEMGTSASTTNTLYTQDGGQSYHLGSCPVVGTDADGDGFTSDQDCNDNDASIYPGAPETCDDGIDQDCDGSDCQTGDDSDQDGYPAGQDCDDNNPNIHPGAFDFCEDGIDQDCDGSDTTCLPAPSCITSLNSWKLNYAPKSSDCQSCHTTCTPGGHSCTEGGSWTYSNCTGCHRNVH